MLFKLATIFFLFVLVPIGKSLDEYWFESKDNRIVNGDFGGPLRPYFAQITIAWKYFCGGTIISDRAVLTAAKCLRSTVLNDYKIYVGSKDLLKGDQYRVANSIVHPEYNSGTEVNDIGILITDDFIYLKKDIVERLRIADRNSALEPNSKVEIMGFGTYKEEWVSEAKMLTHVMLNVESQVNCSKSLQTIFGRARELNNNQFCTIVGFDMKDACHQDAGGPAVFDDMLVGIISWGVGCGHMGYPTVFTYVPRYRNWINTNMIPKAMDDECVGARKHTEHHTVLLTRENSTRCVCTILSSRYCVTTSTCVPYRTDYKQYSIFHVKTYYDIESIITGYSLDSESTVENYDLIIIKSDYINLMEYYGAPLLITDKNKYFKTGLLIKNFYLKGITINDLYSQNERVNVLDSRDCQNKYGELLPFNLTKNHFCIYSKCAPAPTRLRICSDLDGSIMFTDLEELMGLIVWQGKCETHGMAVGVYLAKYVSNLIQSNPRMFINNK